jgi:hypothetical protein
MHFFSLDRGIIVFASFALWIGAAGLICWALLPKQLPDEQSAINNPADVVRLHPAGIGAPSAQISIAQR